jgi:hypothetical protein
LADYVVAVASSADSPRLILIESAD